MLFLKIIQAECIIQSDKKETASLTYGLQRRRVERKHYGTAEDKPH